MGLVRLFLAFVVAADHWWVIVLVPHSIGPDDTYKAGFNAGYAVMFFYVISGYLITYTLKWNYKLDFAGMAAFYRNRFIRIFSLYWPLVVLTFVLIGGVWARFLAADIWDKLTGIFLIGMDWRVAFASYPSIHYDAAIGGLHQAWTLGAELTFYLIAPLLMRSWKLGAALLVTSFGLRAYFVFTLGTDLSDTWTYHFVGTTFGFFMLGHLTCLFERYLAEPFIGLALVLVSFLVMGLGGSYASYDTLRLWGSAILFTLALPGLFEATKNIRWMNLVGDLSYPVYLVHTGVMILLGPTIIRYALPIDLMGPRAAGYLSVAVFLLVTTGAALAVHRLVEVPTAWGMRALLYNGKVRHA
jgi:peptidoglycan/LPS O-acetylase OafA/YrhL